jgi:hypothetical protein
MQENKEKNLIFLKQHQFHAYHHRQPIRIHADDITEEGADTVRALGFHRSNTTVEQYMIVKHKVTLRYSQLPCIVMRELNKHNSYFPIETLYICK